MGNRSRSNALLVEILIAVFFFMLSATVLMRVFGAAHGMTVRAAAESRALVEAQNVAEALAAAGDPDAALADMAFSLYHGAWSRSYDDYTLYVERTDAPAGAGMLRQGVVRAFYRLRDPNQARQADEELFALPWARYIPGEATYAPVPA